MNKHTYPNERKLFRRQDARALDQQTISYAEIDARTLMEVAGAGAAAEIRHRIRAAQPVVVMCGKGNNGGDSLVVARFLVSNGHQVAVYLCDNPDTFSADTTANLSLLERLRNDGNYSLNIVPFSNENFHVPADSILIDGLLGTGLQDSVREPLDGIIRRMNATGVPIFALDIPSGLDADTGLILGHAVRAQCTLCMGTLKLGLYLNDGPSLRGEVVRIDLGFPAHLHEDIKIWLLDPDWIPETVNSRPFRKHKYDQDVVYIVGGSSGLSGAVVLAARAAWSTGVGAVIVISPGAIVPALEKHLITEIKVGVGSGKTLYFEHAHTETVLKIVNQRPGTVLLGPGIGVEPQTAEFVREFLGSYTGRLVLDADALRMIPSGHTFSQQAILTPHPGELNFLTKSVSDQPEVRLQKAHQLAADMQATVLSKGMPVVICDKFGNSLVTGYETRHFSRAGFGDILAGKTTGFFAQSGEDNLSCVRALFDGKTKLEMALTRGVTTPEPLDIL